MASSRKPRPNDPVGRALARALAELPERNPRDRLGLALSGGVDSVVLLHALHQQGVLLSALHVHHGLSPDADAWTGHCERVCATLGIALRILRVEVRGQGARGVEEAAREARYAALLGACREEGLRCLALAHHLDDQAETVLLQLLRGAGPAGLSAMPAERTVSAREGKVMLWRPFLDVPRAAIEDYAARHALAFVEDASNRDTRYVRNALRWKILPEVGKHFPGYRETLARFARLAGEAQRVLDAVAASDLEALRDEDRVLGEGLRLTRWLALPAERQAMVLRHWLAARGLRAPSEARLAQMRTQLSRSAPDARVMLRHQGHEVRRYRDWIVLVDAPETSAAAPAPAGEAHIKWRGERRVAVPLFRGALVFEPTQDEGVPAALLSGQALLLRSRRGRERLQHAPNRPSRTLKNLYQEAGIPAWQRDRLPLLWVEDRLVFAAGLGTDVRFVSRTAPDRVRIGWEALEEEGEPGAALEG